MGDKKDTKNSEKIRFFELDKKGDIRPAFPNKPKDADPSNETRSIIEPSLGPPLFQKGSQSPEIPTPKGVDPGVEEQIHNLKSKVETISRTGVPTADQADILRRYISLKEAEGRDLKEQQRQYQAFIQKLSSQVEELTARDREMLAEIETLRKRNETLLGEQLDVNDKHAGELKALRDELERKSSKSDSKARVRDEKEHEEWRERIREELKRIKLKERELENKYELLKRDAQALLDSKDKHVLELKKKGDALELEMENLEERLRKANTVLSSIESRKKRLLETLRLAISFLESIDDIESMSDEKPRRTG